MHTALRRMNIVGKGNNNLIIGIGILHGDFRHGILLLPIHINDILMDGILIFVDILHKGTDTALVIHGVLCLLPLTFIGNGDVDAAIQERLLPHTGMQCLIVINQIIKHLRVRLEADGGTCLIGGANDRHFLSHLSTGELHLINLTIFKHLNRHPLGQGIDNRGTHAVETAGNLIAAAAKLTAGMEDGINHFQSGLARLGLNVHRDTAAIIRHGNDITVMDGNGDLGAVACQRLINGVVHDLIDQMVQSAGGGGADIHTRTFPDRLQALQNLDLRCVIVVVCGHRSAAFQ